MTADDKFNLDLKENKELYKFFAHPPCKKFKKLLESPAAPLLIIPLGAIYLFLLYLIL